MDISLRRGAIGVASAAALAIAATPLAAHALTPTPTPTTGAAVVSYPVTFSVVNTDEATAIKVTPGNGKTYQVHGHITAPASGLGNAATLYTHGLGYGEWYWDFTAVPGHNFAEQEAAKGLTSVTIDDLGYGASGLPPGFDVGYGTAATVDHQIISDLKDGNYRLDGASPAAFTKVALGAATQSVFTAELENSTWHDASALIETNFADEGFSPHLLAGYSLNATACLTDPLREGGPGTPSGYQYREATAAQFVANDLPDTAPAVQAAGAALHSKDPCGYPVPSALPVLAENNLFDASVTVPVLSVFGSDDSEFIVPLATSFQHVELALDKDATIDTIQGAGSDITIGDQGSAFADTVASWLTARGYAS